LFKEARRRRIFRVAALYVVAAWAALQASDLAFASWDIPTIALRYVWIGAVLGFPVALVFAWRYDIIGGRIVRTTVSDSETDLSIGKADYVILAALALVTVIIATGLVAEISKTDVADTTPAVATDINPRSIAVLPFVTMSSGEDDEYFSDGLTEELINSLVQIEDLKVTGRTSSFYYKDKNEDLRKIGSALGVAHLLEGSVRRSGGKLRITAQLTQASDGFHLWSITYDRNADDIFAIQTDIATQVAEALKPSLLEGTADVLSDYGTTNAEARSLFLIAKARIRQVSIGVNWNFKSDQVRSARHLLEEVVSLDENYAEAWLALAQAYLLQANFLQIDPDDANRDELTVKGAADAVDRARNLAPGLARIRFVEAQILHSRRDWQIGDVIGTHDISTVYEQALAAAPNDVEVLEAAAGFYLSIDQLKRSADLYQQALLIDPLSDVRLRRAEILLNDNLAEARKEYIKAGQLYPESDWKIGMTYIEWLFGHLHHALAWSDEHTGEFTGRLFIWTDLGAPEMALQEIAMYPDDGVDGFWNKRAAALISHDYQGYLDWRSSDAFIDKARSYNSPDTDDRQCRPEGFPLFELFLRDWAAAASVIDDYFESCGAERSALFLGTPAGRDEARELSSNGQLGLALRAASWAYIYQQVGRGDEAAPLWEWASDILELKPLAMVDKASGLHVRALIHAGMGQKEAALKIFESHYREGWQIQMMGGSGMFAGFGGDWGWFEDNPMLDSIRNEPRFKAVVAKVKADHARMLAEYRAGIDLDDIINEDLDDSTTGESPVN